ncbi:MAG: glucose-1-phosphate thymidylyltransferase RfbA [Polyangiaceae bacterium]
MKGVVLAGGSGTRLDPLTRGVSKQLLPVYDKPLVYYPLSVLMLAELREVLVITRPDDQPSFERLLGDGGRFGIRIAYATQAEPRGLAEALIIAREFLSGDAVCLVLGDNLFYGAGLGATLRAARARLAGACLFGYRVSDPERYGVAELDADGRLRSIEEKPAAPKSSIAVTGLYFYDAEAPAIAARLTPSARGQLEITDVNQHYLAEGRAHLEVLGRGVAWLDAGTHDSLLEANNFVQVLQRRQGTPIACLEEIAHHKGWIDDAALARAADEAGDSSYGRYLRRLVDEP